MAIYRDRPPAFADNSQDAAPGRGGRFAERYTLPIFSGKGTNWLADEGSYFNAHNATAGTGIASAAAPTADSDTAVFMTVFNNTSGDERLYLDYLALLVTVAGTAGASVHFTHQVDTINRYSSGGTLLTARNVNMDSSRASNAVVEVGAVTAAAAGGSARKLGHYLLRTVIPVVGDIYRINFGSSSYAGSPLAVGGTAVANIAVDVHPVVIGPGDSWVLTLYLPSQSAASSYEVDMGWVER